MSLILSGTDGLSDVDGTAATPAIRGTDANTGIFFPAADTIAFSEGGVEAARFDSGGNLLLAGTSQRQRITVGTTAVTSTATPEAIDLGATFSSAAGQNLKIYTFNDGSTQHGIGVSTSSSDYLTPIGGKHSFYTGTTASMTLDASGNLGLGTTSPSSRLHVTATASTIGQSRIEGSGVGALFSGMTAGSIGFLHSNTGTLAFGTSTSDNNLVERARIDSSGRLLVGTTSAFSGSGISPKVTISNTAGLGLIAIGSADAGLVTQPAGNTNYYAGFFLNSSSTGIGNISCTSSATAYNTSSDYRLKNTVAPMTGALAKVALLKPVTFKWNVDGADGEGFIAHELAEVVPDCVTGEKDAVDVEGKIKPQGIDTSFLVATLTAAIQEQQALITQLTARLDAANL